MDGNTPTATPEQPKQLVVDKGTYQLRENTFGGAKAGLKYYTLEYKNDTDEQVKSSFEELNKRWKPEHIVIAVNAYIKSNVRTRANNSVGDAQAETPEDKSRAIQKALEKDGGVLISQDDAEKFVPGERELTMQGLVRKAMKLQAEGNHIGAVEVYKQISELAALQAKEAAAEQVEQDKAEASVAS